MINDACTMKMYSHDSFIRVHYKNGGGGGGGANSKKVNIHPKNPEIDLDFFRLF